MNQLVVTNFDGFFPCPELHFAAKCQRLIPREMQRTDPGDGLVGYHQIDGGFPRRFAAVRGFEPLLFAPAKLVGDRLSIVDSILADAQLVAELRAEGRRHEWRVTPLIQTAGVFDLARALELEVEPGTDEDTIRRGLVTALNDKACFQQMCDELGIPHPASTHCRGLDTVRREAKRLLDRDGQVFLRLAQAAGGLGNRMVTSAENLDEVLASLDPSDQWDGGQIVLVEPVECLTTWKWAGMEINGLSAVMQINADGLDVSWSSSRLVRGGESVGACVPTIGLPDAVISQIQRITHRLARRLYDLGYRGTADVDLGVRTDGAVIAFEMNARRIATQIQVIVAERLHPGKKAPSFSYEALRVPSGMTEEAVDAELARVEDGGHVRVVKTIPLSGGKIAVALAARDADGLLQGATELFRRFPQN